MTQNIPPLFTPDETAPLPDHPPTAVDTLKLAMRRARADNAERAGARAELRAARLGRLELLQDALQPLLAQIPADVDMFDIALVPSSEPRLFIDMIGFVEMARDARSYILQQDTRHGRIRVAESESLETMIDAVTDYVARRLLERDKALASDARARTVGALSEIKAPPRQEAARGPRREVGPVPAASVVSSASIATAPKPVAPKRAVPLRWAGIVFAFLIDLLGAIAFFMIVGAVGWYLWLRLHAPT